MNAEQGPIDDYLDDLLGRLHGTPGTVRRILTEVENHLRETAEALQAQGAPEVDAECDAVARFGSADVVARRFHQIGLSDFVRPALTLGAVGFLAIAVSGLLAEVMGRLWGAGFVAGDVPGTAYSPSRCAEFTEYFPGRSCLDAAAMHHWGEVVQYRVAAGVLGIVCLVLLRLIRHRSALPPMVSNVAAAMVFGSAAVVLALATLNAGVQGSDGIGSSLSAAAVAGAVAAYYALEAWRTLRRPLLAG